MVFEYMEHIHFQNKNEKNDFEKYLLCLMR